MENHLFQDLLKIRDIRIKALIKLHQNGDYKGKINHNNSLTSRYKILIIILKYQRKELILDLKIK
jgi:hypothetical protein